MNKINCLIIEDEPLAQDTLEGYIKSVSFLDVRGIYANAPDAFPAFQSQDIDLIFLDINLPVISGIKFLETLTVKPLVIFTTAYPEYAVEGFEANAIDYLLKPFSFERFLKAVNRAVERIEARQQNKKRIPQKFIQGYIMLRADKRLHKVDLSDIQFLESIGDYVKIHLRDKTLVVHETFKSLLNSLPEEQFVQVHKSFIIPLHRLIYIEGNQIKIDNQMIPIGAIFKESLLQKLKNSL
jgi:DNA-binding LytR/AlgR family response regulator